MSDMYGLIFDVDGVIADTEAVNARVSKQVFEELFDITGVRRRDFEAGLGRGAAEYVRAGARAHCVELSDEQIERVTQLRQDYFMQVLESEPVPPFPGVMELMNAARMAADFEVAIATSGTAEKSQAVLKAAGVPYGEMVYINGSVVKHRKPDPELFNLAIEGIEVPPERCVVIEDAPNGVQAGKAAGAKVIAVTNSVQAEKLDQADLIVDSLEQLDLTKLRELIDN